MEIATPHHCSLDDRITKDFLYLSFSLWYRICIRIRFEFQKKNLNKGLASHFLSLNHGPYELI